MAHIIYFNHDGSEGSVFDSQVVAPLKKIKERYVNPITLLSFDRPSLFFNVKKRRALKIKLNAAGLDIVLLPRFPYVFNSFLSLYAVPLLFFFKRRQTPQSFIFHCRGALSARIAIAVKRLCRWIHVEKIIYDCRGDGVAETELYWKKPRWIKTIRLNQLKKLETFVLSQVDHVIAVSEALKDHLRRTYSVACEVTVVPSAVDLGGWTFNTSERQKRRQSFGIDDRLVVVYSGSFLPWQVPDKMLEVFSCFRQYEPRSIFLVLTKDVEIAISHLNRSGLDREFFKVINVDYDKLPHSLCCADVGLLIRETNGVNRVASPTKFSEYVGCGVPVLLTRSIGDTESYVKQINGGWVLDSLESPTALEGCVLDILRDIRTGFINHESIAANAHDFFSLETTINQRASIYGDSTMRKKTP